jgi:adenosylcobinamide-GDP ribazoletransferase
MIALVVCSQTLGRFSSLPLALFMPYARDTNGQGATLTSQIRLGDLFLGAVIAIAVALWQVGMRGCVIDMVVCLLVTFLCGLVFRQKFGGVTGDCLGAANQCVELAILCLPLFT